MRYIGFGLPLGAWLGGDGLILVGGRRVSVPIQVYYVWTILNSCPLESELGETGISQPVLDYALKMCLKLGVAVASEEGDEWRHMASMRVIPQAYPAVSEKHGSPPPLAVLSKLVMLDGEKRVEKRVETLELKTTWGEYELFSEFDGKTTLRDALERARRRASIRLTESEAVRFIIDLKRVSFILLDVL